MKIYTTSSTIKISGDCCIDNAKKIKYELLLSLEKMANIYLDLSEVTECDISFLQIIHAFHIKVIQTKKSFDISISDKVKELANQCGFFQKRYCDIICDTNCLMYCWIKNEY